MCRIIYVIHAIAKRVEDRGKAPDIEWWVQFVGSSESLYFGKEKPFEVGDRVKITFEKEPPLAQPR